MIDNDGFRANVGIIICNEKGQIFWAKRFGQHSWQFPQGGIDAGETAQQAMYRELEEEVGLTKDDVNVLAVSKQWYRYKLPKRLIRQGEERVCIGQKQKWFLLTIKTSESAVDFLKTSHPEFDDWRWVSYWYPVRNIVAFKRDVYRRVMREFAPIVMPANKRQRQHQRKRRNRQRQSNKAQADAS